MHHVVPQAYGGKNGPVIPLCIAHHDLLHLIAGKKIANLPHCNLLPAEVSSATTLEYLSMVICNAHRKVSKDPNKRVSFGVTMSRAAASQVANLCSFHGLSRQDLLLKLLTEEFSRVFPSRSRTLR
jgi:hypothetical protein